MYRKVGVFVRLKSSNYRLILLVLSTLYQFLTLHSQPAYKYVLQHVGIENVNTPTNRYSNLSVVSDSSNNCFIATGGKFSKSTLPGSVVYNSNDGICGFIGKYNSLGNLRWSIPVYGEGTIYLSSERLQGSNAVFVYTNAGARVRIGKDSAFGSYSIVGIDTLGNVKYMIPFNAKNANLFRILKITSSNNVMFIAKFDSTGNFAGNEFSRGIYSVELNQQGQLISNVRLGYSNSPNAIIDCETSDSLIYFHGLAEKSNPFFGSGFEIRALDSNVHAGPYSVDQFLVCLNKNGELKWMHRIDSMGMNNQKNTLVRTRNGNIFWTVNYFKSGIAFGRILHVKFQGYGYTYLAVLDKSGNLLKAYYKDTVSGGDDNVLFIQPTSNNNMVIANTRGNIDGYKSWKYLPDSAKTIAEVTTIIHFDSAGNFRQFNGVSVAMDMFKPNLYLNGYGLVYKRFSPSEVDYNYSGATIKNWGGNDYGIWFSSIFKPKYNHLKAISHSQISIFPNPASTYLKINGLMDGEFVKLSIYNSLGQLVKFHYDHSDNLKQLYINDLRNGVYYLKLENKDGLLKTESLFIQKTQ